MSLTHFDLTKFVGSLFVVWAPIHGLGNGIIFKIIYDGSVV
jgi:hypothetical protein